jgi:hypothetical protein
MQADSKKKFFSKLLLKKLENYHVKNKNKITFQIEFAFFNFILLVFQDFLSQFLFKGICRENIF